MRRVFHSLLALFVALTALSACRSRRIEPLPVAPARAVTIDSLEGRLDRLADTLERQRDELHIPGMAVAIVQGDRLLFARGFGHADLEEERPVTPDTLFAIGSSTKAFCSTLIAMLADEGQMDWDDPVTDFLPWFELPIDASEAGSRAEVTLADMLSHQTGFTRMGVLWASGLAPRETILRTATQAEPWAPFRSSFDYNNVMYLAAGEASAAVAGDDWDGLLRERILQPLGMSSTNTSVRLSQEDERLAAGYFWNDEKEEFERLPMRVLDTIAPAGAINSNVIDMTRWLRFLLARGNFEGQRLVSEERLQDTWRPRIELGEGVSYGLGWFLREWNGEPYVEHGGNIDGFGAEVALLPESNLGLVLLTNVTATPLQSTIGPLVWDALLGELPDEPLGDAETAAAEDEDFEPYLGRYVGIGPFEGQFLEAVIQNERLAIDVPGQMVFELMEPDDEGKRPFAMAPAQIQATFERNARGEVAELVLFQGGLEMEFPREGLEVPIELPLAELERYLGSYQDPAFEEPIALVISHDRLSVDVPGQMVYQLHPPSDDGRWLFRVTDELGVEFHEDDDGSILSLTFHERGTERLCPRLDTDAVPVELPTTEEVLALVGGAPRQARLEALGTSRLSGTIKMIHSGIEGQLETTFAGPRHVRIDIVALPFGEIHSSVHGDQHAFEQSSFEPFDELEGKAYDQAVLSHPLAYVGDWERFFDSVQVIRATEREGRSLWVCRLKRGDLPPDTAYVDAQTGEVVKVDTTMLMDGLGSMPQTLRFEDWREVEGVQLPFRMLTENSAQGRVVYQYETFQGGLDVVDDFFVLRPKEAAGG